MSENTTDFAQLVTGFLTDYLPLQRGYSKNTLLSYRDALKLFVVFLTEAKGVQLSKFTISGFNRVLIAEFLEWCRGRGASVSTTNQRLAALKSFASYAQIERIDYIAPLQDIQAVRSRKPEGKEITFLSVEQMTKLINRPDVNTRNGLRHRTVLTLLYDSGCRVQELCDIRLRDINPENNPTVKLHGKGDKYRTVVISESTGQLVREYILRQRYGALQDQPLIVNRSGKKLSRDGVQYIIDKYAREVHAVDDSFPEHIHCHQFRHSKAMHMLVAGINIVYIRDFLGHEDIWLFTSMCG
jgi:site-specific recombinase XerD